LISAVSSSTPSAFLAPTAVLSSTDASKLYVACEATGEVLVLDPSSKKVQYRIAVDPNPSGLALSPDSRHLYVTCAASQSSVCVIDTVKRKVTHRMAVGYHAQSPVLSPDGARLYVCNRFDNTVSILDLGKHQEVSRITIPREPFAAAVTPDGNQLLVVNHLHSGRSDADVVACQVSVIDTTTRKVIKNVSLPNGSTLARCIQVSPDGRYAVLLHILARFHLPTTQIERGWINSNAASIIDLDSLSPLNTVLLDNIDSGAATPWAVAWANQGKTLLVSHAGSHELSVVDFPALLTKLAKFSSTANPTKSVDYTSASRTAADVPNDLSFLVGLRHRVKLPGKGPRSLTVQGDRAIVAHYFSDSLSSVDLTSLNTQPQSIPLGPTPTVSSARLGEAYFNDASLCFQGWQACSSCHSHDGRVDGLNWDNLNDGIGNPKNSKSLLLGHSTPPSMWLGVRSNAFVAVRAGIRNSLFTVQPPEVAEAMDTYLQSLKPMPSPFLVKGQLSPAAERGRKWFTDDVVGCLDCHKGSFYTDLKFHDVGTAGRFDQPKDRFDTPTLIELWRTGPFLHDGRAATLHEVFTSFNGKDQHGKTSHLTPNQLDDLVQFLLSL